MIFYRSPTSEGGSPMSTGRLRLLTGLALGLYPAGGIILAAAPGAPAEIAGLVMIATAILCALPVYQSSAQRIVAEEAVRLDERERQLRERILSRSYFILSALMLLGIAYAGMASDNGWWTPAGYGAWNVLFWGLFLTASLLPTALLAWSMTEEDADG